MRRESEERLLSIKGLFCTTNDVLVRLPHNIKQTSYPHKQYEGLLKPITIN